MALGGRPDKTGQIYVNDLMQSIYDFGLTIDIDAMISTADSDGSGIIEYEEFRAMWVAALRAEQADAQRIVDGELNENSEAPGTAASTGGEAGVAAAIIA